MQSEQEADGTPKAPEAPPGDVVMADESKESSEAPKDEVLDAALPSDAAAADTEMADDSRKKTDSAKKAVAEQSVMDSLDLYELIHRNNG